MMLPLEIEACAGNGPCYNVEARLQSQLLLCSQEGRRTKLQFYQHSFEPNSCSGLADRSQFTVFCLPNPEHLFFRTPPRHMALRMSQMLEEIATITQRPVDVTGLRCRMQLVHDDN
ncbi:hypothetical protein ABVK25_002121 [Lepraria finkii]|uniref:Uncharacterized protein n=1 Tax=Lepraria finkii TaxID=1340010 RepID=A0ABR4BK06_9LECA